MASIRNRNGAWQVRSPCKSQVLVSKLFTTRHDAERWANQISDRPRALRLTHPGFRFARDL